MKIAFCYESVLPARGGCETYIADLARRLIADGHQVHLYACRRDAAALPAAVQFHPLPVVGGPRFLRPWRFGRRCLRALAGQDHDVTIGFDKVWGLDVLYPQGGLHTASAAHNLLKHAGPLARGLARLVKALDLAHWSYTALERQQYLGGHPTQILVNSEMVRDHFATYLKISPDRIVFTWAWDEDDPALVNESQVTLEFFERDGKTDLVLTHERLRNAESRDGHTDGWTAILENLDEVLA